MLNILGPRLQALMTQAVRLVFPPYCTSCLAFLKEPTVLCDTCIRSIQPVVSVTLPVDRTYSLTVHALSTYVGPLRQLILAKHYGNHLASRQLALLMHRFMPPEQTQGDLLIPIPLHWTRAYRRGFNQAEIMAEQLGTLWQIPVDRALARVRRTALQADLNQQERHTNLYQAFALTGDNRTLYEGKHLILVDDLMTTGTTLQEAARVLAKQRPASISARVACRVP